MLHASGLRFDSVESYGVPSSWTGQGKTALGTVRPGDPGSIVGNAQYKFRGGRYILSTNSIASYLDVEQLFDLDAMIRSVFFGTPGSLAFWYSARRSLAYVATRSDFSTRVPIEEPNSPLALDPCARLPAAQNVQTLRLLSAGSTERATGNHIAIHACLAFAAGFEVPTGTSYPIFSMEDEKLENLTISITEINCLVIAYNQALYTVRLVDPTRKNSILVSVTDTKSVMPHVRIFVNGLVHVNEVLVDCQRMQGVGGAEIVLRTNPLVECRVYEVFGVVLDSGESAADLAMLKTMAESNRLADFFTPPTTFVLDRQTPAIRLGNAMFTCLSGYQLTGDTTNVVLTNGSLWTSNFMCHENLIRLAFKFQARLTPNNEYFSGACTLLQVGLLSATLMAGEGTYLYVTLGQQTLCAAQLTPTTPFRLRLIRVVLPSGQIEVLATSPTGRRQRPDTAPHPVARWPVPRSAQMATAPAPT
jgi:hypothetical protein